MFKLINIKAFRFSDILMGMALMSYLVLSLAGAVLHNHPASFLPSNIIEKVHSHYHDCHGSEKPEKHDQHDEKDHHDCPVCHFNAVVIGAILVKAIIALVALLCLYLIFSRRDNPHFSQNHSAIYLRAPPVFSF
jgi:hypothetical protein